MGWRWGWVAVTAIGLMAGVASQPTVTMAAPAASEPEQSYLDTLVGQARDILAQSGEDKDVALAVTLLDEAVKNNSPDAMRILARLLIAGTVVPADPARAEALLRQAVGAGDVAGAADELGDLYSATGVLQDAGKAAAAYQTAADAGNTGAMRKLAAMLVHGVAGVVADPVRAELLLHQAISAGDVAGAADALGDLYSADTIVADAGLAAAAYQMAANAGSPDAMRKLAVILVRGTGVPADAARAEGLLQQAIAAGEIRYSADALGDLYSGETPLKDPAKAVAAYQQAADAGNTDAMQKLAAILLSGSGSVAADPEKAEALLNQAVSAGAVADAAAALGDLYLADTPLKNYAKAAAAYGQAAEAGNAVAMVHLGRMLTTGADGVPADPARAEGLLTGAVAGGQTSAGNDALGDLYYAAGPLHDMTKAVAAYQAAVDAGNSFSMRKLSAIVEFGQEVPVDVVRAEALLVKAVAAGEAYYGAQELGDLYASDTPLRNIGKAASAYRTSADAGNPDAMQKLAAIFVKGEEVTADPWQAEALLKGAIAAGAVASAAEALGDLYGAHTRLRDPAKAIDAYQQAFDAGNPQATMKLVALLTAGDGVAPDLDRAAALLERVLAQGFSDEAAFALGTIYARDDNKHRSVDKARAVFEQDAAAGNAEADLALVRLASESLKQAKDITYAVDHARSAAKGAGAPAVLDAMMRLPAKALVTIVQKLLIDDGAKKLKASGEFGPLTRDAIGGYCEQHAVGDCNPALITRDLLSALLFGAS